MRAVPADELDAAGLERTELLELTTYGHRTLADLLHMPLRRLFGNMAWLVVAGKRRSERVARW
jgi:hypothetical protein